jgi:hypothetical protein
MWSMGAAIGTDRFGYRSTYANGMSWASKMFRVDNEPLVKPVAAQKFIETEK